MVSPSSISREASSNSLRDSIITLEPIQMDVQSSNDNYLGVSPPTTVMQPMNVSVPQQQRQSPKPAPPPRNAPTPPTRTVMQPMNASVLNNKDNHLNQLRHQGQHLHHQHER